VVRSCLLTWVLHGDAEDLRPTAQAKFARILGMPRNEGWDARPWERVRIDGRGRLDTYMNADSDENLTVLDQSAWATAAGSRRMHM
jgi:hypothetical protein